MREQAEEDSQKRYTCSISERIDSVLRDVEIVSDTKLFAQICLQSYIEP